MGQEAFDTGSYRDYISLGLLAHHNTEAYRYAEEIQAKLNKGREVKNIEMGQLAAAVYADALGIGEKRTAEEQEAPEDDLGDELKSGTSSTASELVLTDDFSRRIIDSRVSSGALDPSSKAAERHAEQYYESVRKMTTDAEKIAKNTGFSTKEIESIKSYVFNEEHDLGEDVPMRFFPSYEMAESWQRLIDGKNIQPHDITLIKHELLESKLVRGGMSQDEAHIIASGIYNYKEEVTEYYDKIKEYKNRK